MEVLPWGPVRSGSVSSSFPLDPFCPTLLWIKQLNAFGFPAIFGLSKGLPSLLTAVRRETPFCPLYHRANLMLLCMMQFNSSGNSLSTLTIRYRLLLRWSLGKTSPFTSPLRKERRRRKFLSLKLLSVKFHSTFVGLLIRVILVAVMQLS